MSADSLVVTEPNGWRFVEQNPTLKIAVAARPEIAEKPARVNDLVVIIPYAAGDMSGHHGGSTGEDRDSDLMLDRPRTHEFEKALVSIGLDEAEATRLSKSAGRSWSVFRRRRAINPAIRRPGWLDASQAGSLSVLCLLGGWSAGKPADREIAARLSSRPYEELERDLRYLARLDDAPVIEIGEVWKAKSPLELLDLFGDRITRDEFDRFFEITHQILSSPDPELELPDEKRFAAQIYDKARPQSGLLIRSLCDTLVKLAVRGQQVPALSEAGIETRIAAFVRDLLQKADGMRWLSLSHLLPFLAEAAPEAFLNAVELSMTKPDAPVTRLFTETNSPAFMGRCWHAGLLWALEILAWAPERLTRVGLALARLAHVEIKGNWGNSPKGSLLNLFRSWLPQTAASIDQRIEVIDTLIAKEPDVAFELLDSLVRISSDVAHPSSRPKWRDDDTGAGHGVKPVEQDRMIVAAADRLIACSKGQPQRIARLIEKTKIFDPARVNATLALADQFVAQSDSDEGREVIRAALRERLFRHINYEKTLDKEIDNELRTFEALYERLSPQDPVIRHRWLFSNGWPNLPVRIRDDYSKRLELIEKLRIQALLEIHAEKGMAGLEQLSTACEKQLYVGVTLAKLKTESFDFAGWIIERGGDFTNYTPLSMTIRGLLRALPVPPSTELIKDVLSRGKIQGWDSGQLARFLALARDERVTWEITASCGNEVENAYWSTIRPDLWTHSDEADLEFLLRRLLEAGRPRSALQACRDDVKKVNPLLLTEILESIIQGKELDGPLFDSWVIGEAVEHIEASGIVERDRLVRLEFGLIPALGYDGEQKAKSLYDAIMSDPKMFAELICIVFKAENANGEEPFDDSMKAVVDIAWHVLRHCRRQPGTRWDGTIDPDAFTKFIDEARDLCREANRSSICDLKIGEILAFAPQVPMAFGPSNLLVTFLTV